MERWVRGGRVNTILKSLTYDIFIQITYHLEALKETSTVDLDVRNIHVSSCSIDGVQLSFKILKYVKITETLGDQLRVTFPVVVAAGTQVQLIVEYSTLDSKESALNWLAPSQTEGVWFTQVISFLTFYYDDEIIGK